jgi:predicted DNA binding CopG/RHH family protein
MRDMKSVKKLKTLPEFKSEDEEREFWASHDSTDYVDWSKAERAIFPNLKPSVRTISLRLPVSMIAALKALANQRDVPYQSLLKVFLSERLERNLPPIAPGDEAECRHRPGRLTLSNPKSLAASSIQVRFCPNQTRAKEHTPAAARSSPKRFLRCLVSASCHSTPVPLRPTRGSWSAPASMDIRSQWRTPRSRRLPHPINSTWPRMTKRHSRRPASRLSTPGKAML